MPAPPPAAPPAPPPPLCRRPLPLPAHTSLSHLPPPPSRRHPSAAAAPAVPPPLPPPHPPPTHATHPPVVHEPHPPMPPCLRPIPLPYSMCGCVSTPEHCITTEACMEGGLPSCTPCSKAPQRSCGLCRHNLASHVGHTCSRCACSGCLAMLISTEDGWVGWVGMLVAGCTGVCRCGTRSVGRTCGCVCPPCVVDHWWTGCTIIIVWHSGRLMLCPEGSLCGGGGGGGQRGLLCSGHGRL